MKHFKFLFFTFIISFLSFTSIHKYYISVTQVNYVKEKKSVQITSRIFIDDLENLLIERYDENLKLGDDTQSDVVDGYIERYLKDKIKFKINTLDVNFIFLGKEYDGDIVRCYLEIENVSNIASIEIKNQVLFDLFEEQQNMIKLKINSKNKSFMLSSQKDKALLTF